MPETIALRAPLLALHRALLEHERRVYEKVHGRQSSADFLQTVIGDPAFAWLAGGSSQLALSASLLAVT